MMGVSSPLTMKEVSKDVQVIFSDLKQNYGIIPNFFGVMARTPEIMKAMLPFANAVLKEGKVDAKFKELAFLKTSLVNGCNY